MNLDEPGRRRDFTALINDGIELHRHGRLDEAEAIYRRVLHEQPAQADAMHLLGVVAHQRKQYQQAEELILGAIALNKRIPEYRNNLGNVYLAQGMLDKAEECYVRALKLNPRFADARNNVGNVLRERKKYPEAAEAYEKALKLEPTRPEIHNNLAMVLQVIGRLDEALQHYQEAIRLKPDFANAYSNLSGASKIAGRLDEAIAYGEKALALDAGDTKAMLNVGNAYAEKGNADKGVELFERALAIDPEFCEAHANLGHALRDQGRRNEAIVQFEEALRLNPLVPSTHLANCIGRIPLLHDSVEEVARFRQEYRDKLESFSRELDLSDPRVREAAPHMVGNCQPFYLAYQGENDRELQSIYGELMVRVQSTCYPGWSKKVPMPPVKPGEPLRVGVLSGFYYLHSNWKIPIKGWVENLNRDDFQLFGYHTGSRTDEQTAVARRSFFQFREGLSFERLCEQIIKDRLHVLIIPEVGMDSMTVQLASLRLAPIQCTSWGHPDTSGLSTIDYYLSSDLMEPDDAQEHYTEKLVRLPNLSIYYEPIDIEPAPVNRAFFELDENKTLFICTQSLFKYLPQYDEVFPRIAKEAGPCQFAFLGYAKSPRLNERFIKRLIPVFARHGLRASDYMKMLPHLTPQQYRSLNQMADVFLDSIGWSGCNSTFEAMACDLPIVTMPGKMMRGRHTHAILQMMGGLAEVEGKNMDEYVAIAVRMARDPEWRKEISRKISTLKHRSYRDTECIRGLEQFLKDAVASFK